MLDQFGGDVRDIWDRVRWAQHDYRDHNDRVRLTLTGLPEAGKKTLFNTLWGRVVAQDGASPYGGVRDFGLFRLLDLPCDTAESDMYYDLDSEGLIVYLVNSVRGLLPEDFQWIARLRTGGAALMVVLNRINGAHTDEEIAEMVGEMEAALALKVLPIDASERSQVHDLFMQAVLRACPDLAVPLSAQISSLRHATAQRVIRQAVVLSLAISAEPLPLLDITMLIGVHLHLLSRLSSLYGKRIARQGQWELVLTVAFGLLLRYIVQTGLKFFPWAGWLLSGVVGASATWAVGQAALLHYEERLPTSTSPTELIRQLGARLHVPKLRPLRENRPTDS